MNNPKSPTLVRALGPAIAISVVVGNVIGSGIFLKPGNIAAEAGRFDVIFAVWILGGLLCILGALCIAELATMFPHAGGLYVYLRQAYGRPVAFLFGWSEFAVRVPGSIAALSVAFIDKLVLATGWSVPLYGRLTLVAVLIVGLAAVNVRGVIWGGRFQFATTAIKTALLGLVALAPLALMPFISSGIEMSNYSTTAEPGNTSLASQIGIVLLAVMWAYNGWHGLTPLAEEVRDPSRNFPRALFIGIGLLIVLYLAANLAYHGVLTMEEMKASGNDAAERMMEKLLGPSGGTIVSLVIMCSVFGAIGTNLLLAPRIAFAMGRDRAFFAKLGEVQVKYRTPAVAIVVTSVMAIGLIALVTFAKLFVADVDPMSYGWELPRAIITSLRNDTIFDLLTNFVIFTASIFYFLAVCAVIVLRFTMPLAERPFKVWGYPFVPLAFLAVYAWFLSRIFSDKPLESYAGIGILIVGVPVYCAYQWLSGNWHRPRSENVGRKM